MSGFFNQELRIGRISSALGEGALALCHFESADQLNVFSASRSGDRMRHAAAGTALYAGLRSRSGLSGMDLLK
ncbi:hypothetical protein [Rhodovulum sulfidophilum]|uniref:hypothetical protein n=1 Tax=Rhodovulum sulfidophilum TaxID=35806 RepID=UPI000951B36D|nr:hypothetical protein [Rhodovulum sulfidophilum]MBL3554587.1 hypothetical protein [Rhodovulum sulfidophilum]OLS42304.1 hypothetical protein BV379_20740 [Rhodovulum sulfidophilum]